VEHTYIHKLLFEKIAPFIKTIEIPHSRVMNTTKGSLSTDHSSLEADTRKADQGIFHI
jgi:hypothetical protein